MVVLKTKTVVFKIVGLESIRITQVMFGDSGLHHSWLITLVVTSDVITINYKSRRLSLIRHTGGELGRKSLDILYMTTLR